MLDSMVEPLLSVVVLTLTLSLVHFNLSTKGCMTYCSFNSVLASTSAMSTVTVLGTGVNAKYGKISTDCISSEVVVFDSFGVVRLS